MRETSSPMVQEVDPDWNITDLLLRNAKESPHLAAYRRKDAPDQWIDISWAEFHNDVQDLAKGLLATGLTPGDTVGIMGRTSYEWTLFDIASWYAGLIPVPVYDTSSPEQIAWIAQDSNLKAILVENDSCFERVAQAKDQCPTVKHVWSMATDDLDNLASSGTDITNEALEAARSGNNMESVATIIYTSGTTGRPKGCVLTHGNFVNLAFGGVSVLRELFDGAEHGKPAATLLFITLAHVFARYVQILCLAGKATMGHTSDMKEVAADLKSYSPSFVLSVPRVFEKVYNAAEQRAKGDGKGAIFARATDVAIRYSQSMDKPGLNPLLFVQHKIFDLLVYRKLREAMGGQLKYAVSGSAPLGERLGHFFRGIGVVIMEGYGLTESTAPTAVNPPARLHIGTVGFPLPGTSIRIAEDGEILLKGCNIFREYHNNADATKDAFVGGWFRTGDLGELTDQGALKITGRKKEILITAGGKNVAPSVLEDRLRAHPLISQAMAVGDGKPFIAALITLDAEMLPTWMAAEGLDPLPPAQACKNPAVLAAIQKAVDSANEAVSRAESIRKFTVLPVDFTVEEGHLTPSLKLKRPAVMKACATEFNELYDDATPGVRSV